MKQQIHNEWFQPISKTSCACGKKKASVYSWGQYINGKWNTIDYCCQDCFQTRVIPRLINHASGCGCSFELKPRCGYSLPDWLRLPVSCAA